MKLEPFHSARIRTPAWTHTPTRQSQSQTPLQSQARPPQAAPTISNDDDWADKVLGTDEPAPVNPTAQSLEAEVTAYEHDTQPCTSVMSFWQVSFYFLLISGSLIFKNSTRKINLDTQLYSALPLISCLSRALQFHASACFRRARRLCQLVVIGSTLISWRLSRC